MIYNFRLGQLTSWPGNVLVASTRPRISDAKIELLIASDWARLLGYMKASQKAVVRLYSSPILKEGVCLICGSWTNAVAIWAWEAEVEGSAEVKDMQTVSTVMGWSFMTRLC